MQFELYKAELLTAIKQYQTQKGKVITQQRQQDCEDLKQIIVNPAYSNAIMLKAALEARVYKMKTGFWIFQTGNSQLKAMLYTIMHLPENQPAVILDAEAIKAEQQLQSLLSKKNRMNDKIAKLETKILENQIWLKLQSRKLDSELYHISYEEYSLNVLYKLIRCQPLHPKEVRLLVELLDEIKLTHFASNKHKAFNSTIADACQFSFDLLNKNIGKLIDHDTLMIPNFKAVIYYAHFYCQSIKAPAANNSPYLEYELNKLLQSYCEDGAGKTPIYYLSNYAKSLVLESKEILITLYGTEKQRQSIAPLCELRQTSCREMFQVKCLEKYHYLTQWLRDKNTVSRTSFSKERSIFNKATPTLKNVS